MSSLVARNSHSSWYGPRKRDIAQEAYQKAVDDLKAELNIPSGSAALAASNSDIHDVTKTVQDAKQKFESQSKQGGARVWLERLSHRIMYYGKVFDSLAQHHPEYVALAWGAIKFVLMGIIGHATLVEKLAQALVAIGDILPRADLSADLYQTDYMRDAMSRLYKYIIVFLRLCVRWYSRGPFGRLWDVVKSPYDLDYKDLFEQIKMSSAVVEDLANAGARAEMRDIRIIQDLHQARFTEFSIRCMERVEKSEKLMMQLMEVAMSHKTITEQVSVDIRGIGQGVYQIEYHQLVQFMAPRTPPADAVRKIQTFARRDTDAGLNVRDILNMRKQIQTWVAAERSSLLVVRTALCAQKQARNLAADLVGRLATGGACVFWNFTLPKAMSGAESMANVFKSLIHQMLTLENSANLFAQFAEQLSSTKVLGTHTDTEWADLVGLLLTKISNAFIVIETEGLNRQSQHDQAWADRFVLLLQRVTDQTAVAGNRLKVLLVVFGSALKMPLPKSKESDVSVTSLQAPVAAPPYRRHISRRSGSNLRSWKLQMPKV